MKRWILALTACCLLAADAEPGDATKSDKDLLQGKWKLVAAEDEGKKSLLTDKELQSIKLHVQKDQFVKVFPPGDVFGSKVTTRGEFKFVLDESKKPKEINLTTTSEDKRGMKLLGIYSLEGNRLKICFCDDGKTRPSEFTTTPKSGRILAVYERE